VVGTYLNKTIDHDMRWWRNTSYNWKSREKKTKKIYDWKKYLSIYDINTVRSRINENVDEKKNEWTNERQKKRKKERKKAQATRMFIEEIVNVPCLERAIFILYLSVIQICRRYREKQKNRRWMNQIQSYGQSIFNSKQVNIYGNFEAL